MDGPILHLSLPVRDLREAEFFYTTMLGCRLGRTRDDWIDVWFFGMQLTLQCRPDEVHPAADQGVRHFGVALHDEQAFTELVERLSRHEVHWLTPLTAYTAASLSGKTAIKVADPSGNVIEIKYYSDETDYVAEDGVTP
jgi:hypothetical protein